MTIALLVLLACADKTLELGDTGTGDDADTAADTGGDTDSADTSDSASDTAQDTGDPDDVNPFTGEWSGTVALRPGRMMMEPPPLCEGDVVLTVRPDGGFGGQADCSSPQAPSDLNFSFSGQVDADGRAAGEVTMSGPQGLEEQLDFRGEFTTRAFLLYWESSLPTPDGQIVDVEGEAVGTPDDA